MSNSLEWLVAGVGDGGRVKVKVGRIDWSGCMVNEKIHVAKDGMET